MYPPQGYYVYGSPIDVIHMHKLNLALNQVNHINNVIIPLFPSQTVASVQAAQAQRAQIYKNEVI